MADSDQWWIIKLNPDFIVAMRAYENVPVSIENLYWSTMPPCYPNMPNWASLQGGMPMPPNNHITIDHEALLVMAGIRVCAPKGAEG